MVKIKLESLMQEKGVTPTDLCMRTGLTPSALSMLRSERAKAVRITTLDILCKVLDCEISDLLEYNKD